jgi:hypothetical protein
MPRRSTSPPRDAGGRFVRRRNPVLSRTHTENGPRRTRPAGIGQLAVLSLAILLGIAGFAFAAFWVVALILMGMLWGVIAVHRQRPPGEGRGLLAEVVDVVVDEARDVADSASRPRASADGHEQSGSGS